VTTLLKSTSLPDVIKEMTVNENLERHENVDCGKPLINDIGLIKSGDFVRGFRDFR
jgi:hypothetical protein